MDFTDYYLTFTDEQTYLTLSENVQLPNSSVDVIGILYFIETGEPKKGYHVNLRLSTEDEFPEVYSEYLIEAPKYPKRVWL